MTAPPAPTLMTPLPAATLLPLRDGPEGLEVLMTTRHSAAGFAGGATVFPGGKVDAADHGPGSGRGADGDAFRVAAIRETFEECGILLARPAGGGAPLSGGALSALLSRMPTAPAFHALIAGEGLTLATDLLVPFAHWITPADQPKRFDTRFFLAPAPAGQVARQDGHEAVEVRWLTPAGAIAAAQKGEIKLVLATRLNLLKLGRSTTVADALESALRSEIVTVQPELVETPDGPAFRIPAAADYGVTEVLVSSYRRA